MKVVRKSICSNEGCQKIAETESLRHKVERNRWNVFLMCITNVIIVSIYKLFYNLIKERNNR